MKRHASAFPRGLIMKLSLRAATFDDEALIKEFIGKAINARAFNLEIKNTNKSINNLYQLEIRPALINCDPAIFGVIDEEVVAFTCGSTCCNSVFDLEEVTGVGIFTYVDADWRRQGVATKLHLELLRQLIKKGCKRVVTDVMIHNTISLASCDRLAESASLRYSAISKRYECKLNN